MKKKRNKLENIGWQTQSRTEVSGAALKRWPWPSFSSPVICPPPFPFPCRNPHTRQWFPLLFQRKEKPRLRVLLGVLALTILHQNPWEYKSHQCFTWVLKNDKPWCLLFLCSKENWMLAECESNFKEKSIRSPLFWSHEILDGKLRTAECITGLHRSARIISIWLDGCSQSECKWIGYTEHHQGLKASGRPPPKVPTTSSTSCLPSGRCSRTGHSVPPSWLQACLQSL